MVERIWLFSSVVKMSSIEMLKIFSLTNVMFVDDLHFVTFPVTRTPRTKMLPKTGDSIPDLPRVFMSAKLCTTFS